MNPNEILTLKLKEALSDFPTLQRVHEDFLKTFQRLGVSDRTKAWKLSMKVLMTIRDTVSIEDAETVLRETFYTYQSKGKLFYRVINEGLQERFEIIFAQIAPYLPHAGTQMIDYGCGSGVLTQMLRERRYLAIEGVDIRDFRADSVSIPIRIFDGCTVPVPDNHYKCGILTNVIHHEEENERILQELDRIVSKKLIIIETVPEADDEESAKKDWGRMLLNDTLWNRFFNYADIPVPGTYDIPSNWIRRFEKYGWKCIHSEDLGFDQPTIQDRHHLFVFER